MLQRRHCHPQNERLDPILCRSPALTLLYPNPALIGLLYLNAMDVYNSSDASKETEEVFPKESR